MLMEDAIFVLSFVDVEGASIWRPTVSASWSGDQVAAGTIEDPP